MKLTIQIVNFRSRHYLKGCLFSIMENLPAAVETEILVVNNDEDPLSGISEYFAMGAPLQILELNKNVGFGRAQNLGFQKTTGDFVLFLNPDTKILPGALRQMLDVFLKGESVGVAGPLLVDAENKIQPDCFGFHRTPLSIVGEKIFSRKKIFPERKNEIFETDWISGGAMIVRRDFFEQVKGFDENFFMYFEDVDLCCRAKKAGRKVVVNPSARIFHESGKSFASEQEKKKHYYASQDYYIRKHFGPAASRLLSFLRLPYYIKNVYFNR
jgi:GT2 family glycosyltransferase